jgi:hypothetical protein
VQYHVGFEEVSHSLRSVLFDREFSE